MATTSDGIWTPDVTNNFNPVSDMATMASTVQSALNKRANSYTGTTAQRTAFTNSAPEGTLWSDTNGEKILWIKQGTGWQHIWPQVDTGWTSLPGSVLQPGFTGSIQAHRVGGRVYLRGLVTGSFVANGASLAAIIPTPFRPVNFNETISPVITNGNVAGRGQVNGVGAITLYFSQAGTHTVSLASLQYTGGSME